MQQRQPRLGDVVDDYCPRERRVTNHAVVAMVGDEIKQTRCTTCDAGHEFKQARVPPQRKKKDVPGALYQQVQHRDYCPPRRERVLEWQKEQEFPICPDPDDPDSCNVYRDLQFPDEVYQEIAEYHEQKAAS